MFWGLGLQYIFLVGEGYNSTQNKSQGCKGRIFKDEDGKDDLCALLK